MSHGSVRAQRTGRHGELVPIRGFSRRAAASLPVGQSAWVSHDGLVVVSSLEVAELPGSGTPPLVGPTWLVSVSRPGGGARCNATGADVARVVDAFAMPAWDEDNHGPGTSRALFCPVEEQYRGACECKTTERVVVEPDGYHWSTPREGPCRGCEYERLFGLPCTIHAAAR